MRNENADNERKKHHRGRRRKKKGNIIANVILVIALIVFCVSGFQLFKIGKGYLDGRSEYDKVRKLAVTDDKNKNDKDKRGYNALVYAVNNDSYEVAKLLLEKGIKVKSEDRIMDMTKSQKMRDLLRDYGIKW